MPYGIGAMSQAPQNNFYYGNGRHASIDHFNTLQHQLRWRQHLSDRNSQEAGSPMEADSASIESKQVALLVETEHLRQRELVLSKIAGTMLLECRDQLFPSRAFWLDHAWALRAVRQSSCPPTSGADTIIPTGSTT